jgi:hypothetical protein
LIVAKVDDSQFTALAVSVTADILSVLENVQAPVKQTNGLTFG